MASVDPPAFIPSLWTRIPVFPGLCVDAHHIVADAARGDGRAWFDVIALADGRAAMLVGDAVDRGLAAADVTVAMRAFIEPLLTGDRDLAWVVERLSIDVDRDDATFATTVCVAIVDPIDGNVQYSTCGHSPPKVVTRRGTRTLRSTGGGVLRRNQPVIVATARLERDEVLVLHTDGPTADSQPVMPGGRVELPRKMNADNDDRCSDDRTGSGSGSDSGGGTSSSRAARTEQVCRTTAQELLRTGTRDGVAVLAVQHRPGIPRLEVTVPAVLSSLETVGEAVVDWLAGLRSSAEDGAGMALAVNEAMTNAIQHAFVGERVGSVTVEAHLMSDGVLACSVRDDGRWLSPPGSADASPGRGLRMMARVADRMTVHRQSGGTVVELHRRLSHPVGRTMAASGGR